MTESDAKSFVMTFEAAWAARDGCAFLALWHPDGLLHSPFYDRPIRGCELGALNDLQKTYAPDLIWALIGWTWRGDTVVVEWETTNRYGTKTLNWRGVDRFRLEAGRIREEVVYADTATIRAMRAGEALVPLNTLPAQLGEDADIGE